jgi:hypothetical protein
MSTTSPYSVAIQNAFQAAALVIPFQFWTTAPNDDVTPPIAGVALDISGWHFMFSMKKDLDDPDTVPPAIYLFDWLIAAGSGTSGQTSVTVPAATINTLEAKFMYYWDLRALVPGRAGPNELLMGTVSLNSSVGQRLVPIS